MEEAWEQGASDAREEEAVAREARAAGAEAALQTRRLYKPSPLGS